MPETILKVSVRPEPIRPNTPVIWPSKIEKEVLRTTLLIEMSCTDSTFLPGLRSLVSSRSPVELARQRATDHGGDDLVAVEGGGLAGDDKLAVAQDGDAVGDQQRLLQRVADEDDRDAARLQPPDQREEVPLLLRRQRRRRLVEDDDLGVVVNGAGDLDHLPLGRAQRRDHGGRVDRKVQRLQELLRRDVGAAQPVEEAFGAEIEVLRHRHRRHQAGLLEHHGDAGFERCVRRGVGDLLALVKHLAGGRRRRRRR